MRMRIYHTIPPDAATLKARLLPIRTVSRPGNLWRSVHGRISGRPTNFSWVVPGRVAGSGFPTTLGEFEWLLQQGIGGVVTMTENSLPTEWTGRVSYLHVPTPDMTAPEPEDIDAAVDFIHRNAEAGRPTAVHCAAGLGRAGTILACYLVKHKGYGARQAINEIRLRRPGSIQSDVQETAIMMYERFLD